MWKGSAPAALPFDPLARPSLSAEIWRGSYMATVLVVDDEVPILNIVRDILELEGHTVQTALNGRDALRKLEQELPDLVMSDIMMPLLNGIELCRELKRQRRFEAVPVILFSAAQTLPDPTACAYDATLSKPFEIDTMLQIVDQVLQHA
jgi:CheY-like chemotaxis protein